MITNEQLIKSIRAECKQLGSQQAFADKYGISRQRLNDMLAGRRNVPVKLSEAMGYRRVTGWEKVTK